MSSFCPNCRKAVDFPVRFRSLCERCGAYLHSCKGCRFYEPGRSNDCSLPGTEPPSDPEAGNFCEDFLPLIASVLPKKISDIEKDLFKG